MSTSVQQQDNSSHHHSGVRFTPCENIPTDQFRASMRNCESKIMQHTTLIESSGLLDMALQATSFEYYQKVSSWVWREILRDGERCLRILTLTDELTVSHRTKPVISSNNSPSSMVPLLSFVGSDESLSR
jgi:hypothetical protein